MRILFILLVFSSVSYGQYSTYYLQTQENIDLNANVQVQHNISTIDYGALAKANAERERTRLEAKMYSDELEKQRALEIAQDPLKAFDYGTDNNWEMDKESCKNIGIKKGIYYHKIPHESLFVSTGGYNYRNESEDGVITEIEFNLISYVQGLELKDTTAQNFRKLILAYNGDTEKYIKDILAESPAGKVDSVSGIYTHKTDINKAKVIGENGFMQTYIYEDGYEYVIKDNFYLLTENGWFVRFGVRYKGDKDDVTFEMLEGRRYYFKRLVNQMFATATINGVKY